MYDFCRPNVVRPFDFVASVYRALESFTGEHSNTIGSLMTTEGLDNCYSAAYMSQTRDQQRFTISEVAANWHGAAAHYVTIHCPR